MFAPSKLALPLLATLAFGLAACEKVGQTASLKEEATGTAYPGAITLSLAHPYDLAKDDFELLLAAPNTVKAMAVCHVRDGATCAPGTQLMYSASLAYATGDRMFYKVNASALLEAGLTLRFIAYDATGTVIDARTVVFSGQAGATPPSSTGTPPNGTTPPSSGGGGGGAAGGEKVVTFYGDVLPFLSSNAAGSAYKCTTCHAHYNAPDGLNSVGEVDRMINAMESGRMPRGGDPVPADKVALLRKWQLQGFKERAGNGLRLADVTTQTGKINADRDSREGRGRGEPYKAAPAGYDQAMAASFAEKHKTAKGPGYKYVYVPAGAASDKQLANILRVSAGKAWNHLSWIPEMDVPEDVSEGAGLVFALNLTKVWGADADKNWAFVANCSPKANIQISPAPEGDCERFAPDQPVAIPRFVFNATNGGPYANVHKTPTSFNTFTRSYKLGSITHTSTHKEAIVCGPRITAYRTVKKDGLELLYSYTTDEFDGRDGGSINYQSAPTEDDQRGTGALNAGPNDGGTAVASEWWIQLPNGFIYYGIHGEGSQERGKAEFPFAIDPMNWKQGSTLATGRSCITCHANGIQSAPSDAEFAGKNGWSTNDSLAALYGSTRTKFTKSMQTLVSSLSDGDEELNSQMVKGTIEPVTRAIREVEGPYDGGAQGTGTCRSFCDGKFSSQRLNFCATMPQR